MAQAPRPWEMGMQPAFGPVKDADHRAAQPGAGHHHADHAVRRRPAGLGDVPLQRERNPIPSRTSHNTMLEIAWTVIPVLILVVIAIPSFRLVYYEDRTRDADLTIKVTGHQWYWEYTYPDKGNLDFTSYIVPDEQLKPGQLRLLEVDNQLVVPVGKNIRVLTTSADVIHSFFIPALGVQRYAIPGPDDRDLVPRRQARHLLRPVQPDLRHQPQPDADRGARGAGAGIQRLARPGEDQVLGCGAGQPDRADSRPCCRGSALTRMVGALRGDGRCR